MTGNESLNQKALDHAVRQCGLSRMHTKYIIETYLAAMEDARKGEVKNGTKQEELDTVSESAGLESRCARPSSAKTLCPVCNGNDADIPCAYPREHESRAGCLRNNRLFNVMPETPIQEAPLHAAMKTYLKLAFDEVGKERTIAVFELLRQTVQAYEAAKKDAMGDEK